MIDRLLEIVLIPVRRMNENVHVLKMGFFLMIFQDGGHVEKITVTLPLDGKSHVLDLQLNR